MNPFWNRPLPVVPFTLIALGVGIGALLLSRRSFVRGLWRERRRARDRAEEPDRVWTAKEGGPWMVTFCGEVYEVWSGDLPKGRALPRGLMSDETFGMLARSNISDEAYFQRTRHFDRGDLIAARLVQNTSDPDSVPWRIDALDRENAYRLFGFEDERDARNVLELLRRRVLPLESGVPQGAAADDAIDAARRRDEDGDGAAGRPFRKPAGSVGTGGA